MMGLLATPPTSHPTPALEHLPRAVLLGTRSTEIHKADRTCALPEVTVRRRSVSP